MLINSESMGYHGAGVNLALGQPGLDPQHYIWPAEPTRNNPSLTAEIGVSPEHHRACPPAQKKDEAHQQMNETHQHI